MQVEKIIDASKLIKRDLILTNLDFNNSSEIIKELSLLLEKGDYVKDTFCQAVIKREKEFPTALLSKDVKVAIPHTDSEFVNKSAIAIAVLSKPIIFRQMDDPNQEINVDIVFLLAIKNSKQQLKVVQKMIELFQKPGLLLKMKTYKSSEKIQNILINNINN